MLVLLGLVVLVGDEAAECSGLNSWPSDMTYRRLLQVDKSILLVLIPEWFSFQCSEQPNRQKLD